MTLGFLASGGDLERGETLRVIFVHGRFDGTEGPDTENSCMTVKERMRAAPHPGLLSGCRWRRHPWTDSRTSRCPCSQALAATGPARCRMLGSSQYNLCVNWEAFDRPFLPFFTRELQADSGPRLSLADSSARPPIATSMRP